MLLAYVLTTKGSGAAPKSRDSHPATAGFADVCAGS